MSSHRSWILAVVVSALMVVLGASAFAQVKVPPDFSFTQGKDSPGPVTFSHEKHKERAEKCNVCHVKVFKMKKIATSATASDVNALLQCLGTPGVVVALLCSIGPR